MTRDAGAHLVDQAAASANAGRLTEALDLIDRAVAAAPDNAAYAYHRGRLLYSLGRDDDAIEAFGTAAVLNPGFGEAHYNRALLMQRRGQLREALQGYDAALAVAPRLAEAWNNRAAVLRAIGDFPGALASIDQALSLRPGDASSHYNRGAILMALQRFADAQAAFEYTLRLAPNHDDARALLMSSVARQCKWDLVAALRPAILAAVAEGSPSVSPLLLLALSDDAALQRQCATAHVAADVAPAAPAPLWRGETYAHERLRIAYMSGDFRDHPVGAQIVGVLEGHDRSQFEVHGLFVGANDGSALTQRIAAACAQFHQVQLVGDAELAGMLRALEIDVLVDLNGLTDGNRLRVLQFRPAPVQATYLGYAGTTGAPFIDYILADAETAPFADQAGFSEQIVHLPYSFWPCDPAQTPPSTTPARASFGVPEDAVVFCAFNAYLKFNEEMFGAWMRVLAATPGSVLWLRREGDAVADALREQARQHGIDPARLVWADRIADRAAYFARHGCADLFLDTFPYGAHVTASDALWSGLPVLTRRGGSFASRVAASLLSALDVPELVTHDLAEYERLAIALGNDRPRLAALRQRIETGRTQAPLFRRDRLVRGLERAYTRMVETARGNAPPRGFAVDPE